MKTRPILFSTPMVQALLGGSKTMTRRIVKPHPHQRVNEIIEYQGEFLIYEKQKYGQEESIICPYGQPGDLLWVREGFRCNGWATDVATILYKANERDSYTEMCEQYSVEGKKRLNITQTWKPSIHMPRWANRITLEITDIRVERLNDISEVDAKKEGAASVTALINDVPTESYDEGFARLWESINGEGSWDQNPWVWVVKFKVHKINVDDFVGSS